MILSSDEDEPLNVETITLWWHREWKMLLCCIMGRAGSRNLTSLSWERRQTLVPFSPTGLTHCCFHCLPRYKDSSSSKTASCSTMQRARRETLRATGTSTSTPRWAAASSLSTRGKTMKGGGVTVHNDQLYVLNQLFLHKQKVLDELSRTNIVNNAAMCFCLRASSLWEDVWCRPMKTWACPSPSWSTWRIFLYVSLRYYR